MTFCLFTNFCCSVSQTADWQGTKQRGQHVHSRGHHLYNAFHADIPHRHTFRCQLSLLFIICPKTKNHPLLASATRLSPVSSSSHGDASVRGKECIHSAASTTHAVCDHQGGYCTADHVTCHSTMKVQIPNVQMMENSRAQWAHNVIRSM